VSGFSRTVAGSAVYRLITNFADTDSSLVTIGPGICGQPGSPFYGNLLQAWAGGEFFPLACTRPGGRQGDAHTLVLKPAVRR
jgi:acyl-homoserine lactone acylase PvdQ